MDKETKSESKISLLSEFWDFLKTRKKWWLGPIAFILLMMSLLIGMDIISVCFVSNF